MDSLESLTGYTFQNPALLTEALTHPSLGYETQRAQADNQRLEFLGDAVLQLILTHHLYATFPDFSEGKMTKLRSRLVSRPALAAYARRINLGAHLRMGRGEENSGGRDRAGTLADAFEALIAAIYLDGGLEEARAAALRLCHEELTRLMEEPVEMNPKGELQELLQTLSLGSPRYQIISEEGPDHLKTFVARVDWNHQMLGTGAGGSKKEAETAAAAAALLSAEITRLKERLAANEAAKSNSSQNPVKL